MSRNGSGTYSLPAGNPVVSGTTITTTWANSTLSDIASALTGSVAADGQTPMSGALNMAGNKISSVADPSSAQDAATKAYVDANIPNTSTFLTKANNLSDVNNATTSRTNLSAAKSGANSDITSLTGLTTPLTVAQGGIGTGTLTANNVLLGNGTSAPQTVAPGTSGNILTSNGTTWTSAAPASVFVGLQGQLFTSSGTFTIPTGISAIKVTVVGGGGGGGNAPSGGYRGGNGGASTITSGTQTISTVTGGGGQGGVSGSSPTASSGGTLNFTTQQYSATGYGIGGSSDYSSGSASGQAIKFLTGLTPGNTISVTVGSGGSGGAAYNCYPACGSGTAGLILFEW
jgi:hypothetical protein